MAFVLKNFGQKSQRKIHLGWRICYYRYFNAAGDITTAGYFPSNLGLKVGDRICVIPTNH